MRFFDFHNTLLAGDADSRTTGYTDYYGFSRVKRQPAMLNENDVYFFVLVMNRNPFTKKPITYRASRKFAIRRWALARLHLSFRGFADCEG